VKIQKIFFSNLHITFLKHYEWSTDSHL
jgi:hypothetical protein